MPRINNGEAPLYVEVSLKSKKVLEREARSRGISMGEYLDELIDKARQRYSVVDMRAAKRGQTLSLIISERSKEWLKNFAEKTNLKMSPLVEKIIEEAQ